MRLLYRYILYNMKRRCTYSYHICFIVQEKFRHVVASIYDLLTSAGRNNRAVILQTTFPKWFSNGKWFYSNWSWANISSSNGLVLNKRYTIIWNNMAWFANVVCVDLSRSVDQPENIRCTDCVYQQILAITHMTQWWNGTCMRQCSRPSSVKAHWGRDKMADIFQMTFSNAFVLMKMLEFRLNFHWSLFPWVQLTIFQHWFR